MTAYYNEIEPYAAAWLRNLIVKGHIAPGEVDERSIVDVRPSDLGGYTQCHFFSGIGGWGLALRLAEWPDDNPVWTGSCPCQPFSVAGKRKGFDDDRHLWPIWFELIRQCRPPVVFGEQVARAIGAAWLDTVGNDLEGEGYAFGSAVLPACAVAAPHVRDRLWFVADARGAELRDEPGRSRRPTGQGAAQSRAHGPTQSLADSNRNGCAGTDLYIRPRGQEQAQAVVGGNGGVMADANGDEQHRRASLLQVGRIGGASEAEVDAAARRIEWPAEPDIPRVAHGVPNRVERLRAYGNAIVPQVAAEFIRAAI